MADLLGIEPAKRAKSFLALHVPEPKLQLPQAPLAEGTCQSA